MERRLVMSVAPQRDPVPDYSALPRRSKSPGVARRCAASRGAGRADANRAGSALPAGRE